MPVQQTKDAMTTVDCEMSCDAISASTLSDDIR